MTFNAQQLAAIESTANRICVLASAGSGKTSTLCARAEHLVRLGADPRQITIVTYTNAAASNIQQRLKFKVGCVSTLHAFCIRLIKQHHELAGLPETLSVVDDDMREEIARRIVKEMGAKVSMKRLMELLDDPQFINPPKGRSYAREELAAVEYHRQMRRNGVLDFNEILHYGLVVAKFLEFEVGRGYEPNDWFFKHLFCDEFQDVADIDFEIYMNLPCTNKFIVGDDSQSVYAFRGSNMKNFLNLALNAAIG